MSKSFFLILLNFVLYSCATISVPYSTINADNNPEIAEIQNLLEAELFTKEGNEEAASEAYYKAAVSSTSEEVLKKSFIMLVFYKKYDKSQDIATKWANLYKNKDSAEAQIINNMFLENYANALVEMDYFVETYNEDIYEIIMNFNQAIPSGTKKWFYNEFKSRYANGNLHIEEILLTFGAGEINSLLREENLVKATEEINYLLKVLNKSTNKKDYFKRKESLLALGLEVDMQLNLDIQNNNYTEVAKTNEKMYDFYIKLAKALALFPDNDKLQTITQLLKMVVNDKNVDENFVLKVDSIDIAKSLKLDEVLELFANNTRTSSKDIYLKNLATFYLKDRKINESELEKLVNYEYLLGSFLTLEYFIFNNDTEKMEYKLNQLISKYPEKKDLIVSEYLGLLDKYRRDEALLSKVNTELAVTTNKKWGYYKEYLYFMRSIYFSRKDDVDSMEEDFREILSENPNSILALNGWGYFLADKNTELGKAEKMLNKAIELAPENIAILDSIGWLWFKQEKFDDSLNILLKCYGNLGENELAYHLAKTYIALGNIDKATKLAKKIWLDDPNYEHLTELLNDLNLDTFLEKK